MNITPVSMQTNNNAKAINFAGKNQKAPVVTATTPDDTIVAWGSWDPNYRFPITAGQIKADTARLAAAAYAKTIEAPIDRHQETPEEYYQRKLYSPEWAG